MTIAWRPPRGPARRGSREPVRGGAPDPCHEQVIRKGGRRVVTRKSLFARCRPDQRSTDSRCQCSGAVVHTAVIVAVFVLWWSLGPVVSISDSCNSPAMWGSLRRRVGLVDPHCAQPCLGYVRHGSVVEHSAAATDKTVREHQHTPPRDEVGRPAPRCWPWARREGCGGRSSVANASSTRLAG